MPKAISDKEFEAMKSLLNTTIHELVFAAHHMEEDALMTAQGNLDQIAEELVKYAD